MYQPGTKEYKRITYELEKLGGNPLVGSDPKPEKLDLDFDFKAHAKEFRDLSKAVVLLADSVRGRKEWICGPDSKDNLDQPGPNYYNLVKLAAVACGYPNDDDGAHAWHLLLERDSPFCAEWHFTDPREASARYCEDLHGRFYAIKRSAIAPRQPEIMPAPNEASARKNRIAITRNHNMNSRTPQRNPDNVVAYLQDLKIKQSIMPMQRIGAGNQEPYYQTWDKAIRDAKQFARSGKASETLKSLLECLRKEAPIKQMRNSAKKRQIAPA